MQQDSTTDMAQSKPPKPNAPQHASSQHAHQHARNQHGHRLSVAPMMDWTDRHCRVFHRMLAPHAALYSEMVTADAIIHGDRDRLLAGHHMTGHHMTGHHKTGHRMTSEAVDQTDAVILQLGGSDPEKLARAIGLAAPYQYAEYNLNVGCPSDRVQSGRFGACLMAEPELVAECMAAMINAAGIDAAGINAAGDIPATVKCRIGIDDMDPEQGLNRFVETVAKSGVQHFIIHARKAWLNGLSPKENRTIPPLDYDRVIRLKQDFPDLKFSINGGISRVEDAVHFADIFYGVMVGRAAYQTPNILAEMAAAIYGHDQADRMAVAMAMADYAEGECAKGTKLIAITRHMLGLMHGLPGAKAWRRSLSEDARGDDASPDVIRHATEKLITEINRRTLAA